MPSPSPAYLHEATVVSNEPMAPGVMRMTLRCPELAATIQPGQFFNLAVPGDPTEMLRLPFSFAAADPASGEVTLAYLLQGNGTRRMQQMAPGTVTDLLGPGGHGWRPVEGSHHALLVGGGSGTAPLVPLTRALASSGVTVDFVQGAPTAERVLFEEEITAAGAARFEVATDDGTRGTRGFCTEVVARLLSEGGYDAVYTCGPEPMMRSVAKLAEQAGVPCQVSMERGMVCGFGACATCVVDTKDGRKGACMHGPVFDAEEVVW